MKIFDINKLNKNSKNKKISLLFLGKFVLNIEYDANF